MWEEQHIHFTFLLLLCIVGKCTTVIHSVRQCKGRNVIILQLPEIMTIISHRNDSHFLFLSLNGYTATLQDYSKRC
jgi:hypothetical protein